MDPRDSSLRPLRALTLHRPYPWAMLYADPQKIIENRSWSPWPSQLRRGEWLALHAGSKFDLDGLEAIREIDPRCPTDPEQHPTGIVGMALFRGWRHVDDLKMTGNRAEVWIQGPICWCFDPDETVAFNEPVDIGGKQLLWTVPEFHVDEIRRKMRAV